MKRFFDTELESFRSDLFQMGEAVIAQLRTVLTAYAASDPAIAQAVIDGDDRIDELERQIDEEAIRYMSLRQPIATQLRAVVTGMKAGHDLERAADEVTKIARRVRHLATQPPLKIGIDVVAMGEIAAEMLRDALACFFEDTEDKALGVCRRDIEVDRLNRQLCDELTQTMMQQPETVSRAVDLMFVSKAIERVADHATNVAEETIFLLKARDVRHTPEVKKPAADVESSHG